MPEDIAAVFGLGDLLSKGLDDIEIGPAAKILLEESLKELNGVQLVETTRTGLWPRLPDASDQFPRTLAALSDEEAGTVLELLCDDLEPDQWLTQALLARIMWSPLTRESVGPRVHLNFRNPWNTQ